MKGKILILEDRVIRQKNSLYQHNINLADYVYLDNKVEEDFDEVYNNFKAFLDKNTSTYDVIIAHESKFRATEKDELLRTFCRLNQIKLVYYSGGIGSTFYNVNSNVLYMNSNDLYSKRLSLFFEDYKDKLSKKNSDNKINLLILAYGNNWKINILLNSVEKLNSYLFLNEKEDNIFYDDFKKKTNFDIILENQLIDISEPKYREEDGLIIYSDIKIYIQKLKEEITKKVHDEL